MLNIFLFNVYLYVYIYLCLLIICFYSLLYIKINLVYNFVKGEYIYCIVDIGFVGFFCDKFVKCSEKLNGW